ncbi:MAG: zinc-dependent metalloprotease, partial [Akkermansiaceae bacterium]|nr:zinc-dependent metalloprotease [Armatimonadota bacterium]
MNKTVSPFPANRKRTALRISSAVLTLMLGGGFVPTQSPRAAFAAADKFYLVYRAEAGQVKKTKADATIKFEVAGQAITMDYKGTSKVTYAKVSPNGDVTLEDKTESEEYTVNGAKAPAEEVNDDTSTVTLKPNGEISGYKEEKKDKDDESDDVHLGVRLQAASTPIFPAKTVGTGDKWSHDYKASTELGTRDAHADFELIGFEKIGEVNTAKIKITYAESGSDAIAMKGTVYVDVATGDPVRDDFEATGIPFGPDGTKATGTFHDERTDGGPYAANKSPQPLTEAPKAVATAKADDKKPGAATVVTKPGETKPIEAAKPPEPKKDKTIDETVKEGFTKIPGLVTLYRKKEAGKDTIYAELPEDQLGKMMMLQATASTGTAEQIVAGDPINDIVFKLEKIDDRIFFTIPNFFYRAANPEIAKSVRRSFADGYLQAFKIEAKQAERKSVLIDISDLFRGDLAQISAAFAGGTSPFLGMSGGGGFGMDRDKTFIKEMKNFPENLVVSTQYHFQRGGRGFSATLADSRSAPITVVYNLSVLPGTTDYTPRLSDDRIGYFETGFQSFDDDAKRDQLTRYILRWDLKKKDPNAALSEPVKPITFWLDNAIPKEYRPAFEKAFLIWNSAFEKVGFKNAIVVKQMPDNPDPKDPNTPSDTADMRFNCIRYVHSPDNAYAVALFRTNPMTGQILNASITVDAGIVRFTKVEHQKEVDPAQAFAYGAGIPQEEERLRQKLAANTQSGGASFSTFSGLAKHNHADPRSCSLAHEAKTQAHFGYHALAAQSATGTLSPTDMKAYTDQFIIEVVGHEFGHILGLRHNFIASKEYTLAQLGDKATTDKGGIGASLMDYNAFNIAALNKKGAAYYSTNIGTYDRWAVEYGYTPIPAAKTPDDEKFALAQIAKQSGRPGHAYLSDEVADSFDPDVARFDMGKDNLEYQKQAMNLSRKLLSTLDRRVPKNGESYWEFTQDFNTLLGMYARGAGFATRFIGGQNISHSHRGDMNEKPALSTVSADTQRQALAMLVTNVFAPDAMPVPKRYYSKLASDPTGFGADEVPMLDRLSSIQRTALSRLFSATMLSRIANNEYKAAAKEKPVTLPYLFQTVGSNVWAEIPAKTDVNPLRRNLQRAYVDRMIDVALKGGVNADAQMLAWNELRGMKTKLVTAKAVPTLDTYTRAHYADSFDKINRALDARITLGQASSGPNINDLLSLLMGKTAQDGATAAAQTESNI